MSSGGRLHLIMPSTIEEYAKPSNDYIQKSARGLPWLLVVVRVGRGWIGM